jgi:hypothetical protein
MSHKSVLQWPEDGLGLEAVMEWESERYINSFLYWNLKRHHISVPKEDRIFLAIQAWKHFVQITTDFEEEGDTEEGEEVEEGDEDEDGDECDECGTCHVTDGDDGPIVMYVPASAPGEGKSLAQ